MQICHSLRCKEIDVSTADQLTATFRSKAWFPYNRPDRTKQCTGGLGDFMETVKETLGTIEATAAITIARIELCSIQAIIRL